MVKSIDMPSTAQMKKMLPIGFGALFIWLLWQKSATLDWGSVSAAFGSIPLWRWGAALAATGVSFWAIAQYDVIAHRHFQTGISDTAARRAGAAGIALGQTIGFGPAVGAAVRWRLMPDLGHTTILSLTGFVTLGFISAWAVIATTLALPLIFGVPALSLVLLPAILLGLGYILMRYPNLRLFGHRLALPSLSAMGQMGALAACDVIFAGLALHLMLPPEMALSLPVLVACFTLALGAGMLGGTPGGMGPFEFTLVMLLPGTDMALLAAGLIGFRLVYYAIPCLLAAAYGIFSAPAQKNTNIQRAAPMVGARAEHGIAAQSDSLAIHTPNSEGCALRTPQSLALFLGATRGSVTSLLQPLEQEAKQQNRFACLYKLTARDAARVRGAGWKTAPFAVEAIIDPQTFALEGSDRRQLRRQIRKAEKSGIKTRRITAPNWGELKAIHDAWEASHGQERGLTMGRFCPLFLQDKPIFGAFQNDRLIGYITGVCSDRAVSLDIMRHIPNLPAGTMHALVCELISYANSQNLTEVSLAAVPHPSLVKRFKICQGLNRFKASFGPQWRPVYMAAPNHAVLALTALDIWLAIRTPAPIVRSTAEAWQVDAMLTGETPFAAPEEPLRRVG